MANKTLNSKKIEQAVNPMISDPGDGYSVVSDTMTVKSSYKTEETKHKAPKISPRNFHSYLDVLYDEWFNKLKSSNVSEDKHF